VLEEWKMLKPKRIFLGNRYIDSVLYAHNQVILVKKKKINYSITSQIWIRYYNCMIHQLIKLRPWQWKGAT